MTTITAGAVVVTAAELAANVGAVVKDRSTRKPAPWYAVYAAEETQ